MTMKNVFVEYNEEDILYISEYGMENISENAHWGKGSRNVYIIHYVLRGEGYYNGVKVKENQGFFIEANKVHEYHSSGKKPWEYFWIVLNGSSAFEICKRYISPDKKGIFDYDFKSKLKTFADGFFGMQYKISQAKAKSVFWMLMSYHEKNEKTDGNKYVTEAKKYMEQHCYRPLGICEVANILHISDRYLYNLFVKFEGISPKKYLNSLKVKKAQSMLKETPASVTEVAVSVGFEDVLTFSRFFKKETGMSPSEFKRK